MSSAVILEGTVESVVPPVFDEEVYHCEVLDVSPICLGWLHSSLDRRRGSSVQGTLLGQQYMDCVVKGGISRWVQLDIVWMALVEIKDVSFDKFNEGSGDEIGLSEVAFLCSARGEK